MRILRIRFKNLNSLVGEWDLDLTHPAFISNGIFAITGPTGAGKTTILDALCLALYGRTPRLSRISKSGNEIMSRQTGECFAEVMFETQTGRFRCHWSQRRARTKANGELQAPKHEIANADSGEIFESKLRGVAEHIETVTGMDFDRFTRSMLLAQGGFAAFLQAAPDDRAPILEQITGTEVYSRISMRVHERLRDERDTLRQIQAETATIAILTPEQENERSQALTQKQKEEITLTSALTKTNHAIAWLTAIDGLRHELNALTEERRTLHSRMHDFAPQRSALALAMKISALDGIYATLSAHRTQYAHDQTALHTLDKALPQLEATAAQFATAAATAEQQVALAKKEQLEAAPLIQRVRALDLLLAEKKKARTAGEQSCIQLEKKIAEYTLAKREAQKKINTAQTKLDAAQRYLTTHAHDEWLVHGLTGVEEQLRALVAKQGEMRTKETEQAQAATALTQAKAKLTNSQKQRTTRAQELTKISQSLTYAQETLKTLLAGQLLREYRTQKETLLRELAFRARIAELEEHRAKLEDGAPCPLCGATSHPFAHGNIPIPDALERDIAALTTRIHAAEEQETHIKKLEAAATAAHTQLIESEKREIDAAHIAQDAEKAHCGVHQEVSALRAAFAELKQVVLSKLTPLGITEVSDTALADLIVSLRARLTTWQAQIQLKAEIEKELAGYTNELHQIDTIINLSVTSAHEQRAQLENLKNEYDAQYTQRTSLFGVKKPDTEESRLHKAISGAEETEKNARTRHLDHVQRVNTAVAQATSLRERLTQHAAQVQSAENGFRAGLEPLGLADEQAFLAARMTAEQQQTLAATAKELDDWQTDLNARHKDRETRLATELAKKITDTPLQELQQQASGCAEALQQLRESIASLAHALHENTAAKERVKNKQTAIEAHTAECRRWENLHELIGSADGKKYRNFAQGLTFELMVAHANRQLQKMTDRYLLLRDDGQPLDLNVVDTYQAGEIRSTKNLSGGESFLVSLALALGLSHMASHKVRVDSLFLDEGFGTLDEDALETALETLSGLHQDGKLIGVISHVPALKERICTQIEVSPHTGARSQISGPGCSRRG